MADSMMFGRRATVLAASIAATIGSLAVRAQVKTNVGDQDGLRVDAGKLHEVLDQYGIANSFEVYPGTHTSDVGFSST